MNSILPVHQTLWTSLIRLKQPISFKDAAELFKLKEALPTTISTDDTDLNSSEQLETPNKQSYHKVLDYIYMNGMQHFHHIRISPSDTDEGKAYIESRIPPNFFPIEDPSILLENPMVSTSVPITPVNLFSPSEMNMDTPMIQNPNPATDPNPDGTPATGNPIDLSDPDHPSNLITTDDQSISNNSHIIQIGPILSVLTPSTVNNTNRLPQVQFQPLTQQLQIPNSSATNTAKNYTSTTSNQQTSTIQLPPVVPPRLPPQTAPHGSTPNRIPHGYENILSSLLENSIVSQKNTLRMEQNTARLESVILESVTKSSSNNASSSTKRTLLDSLTDTIKTTIKRGSAEIVTFDEPTDICASCLELYSHGQKSRAMSYMDRALREERKQCTFQQGHLTLLLHGGPVWSNPTTPEGLTVFGIHPRSTTFQEGKTRRQEIQASLKIQHDNHLEKEDIEFLVAEGYHFPTNIYEFESMLSTFAAVLGIYFGKDSIITRAVNSCLDHYHDNIDTYHEQSSNTLWCAKVLYAIDNTVQAHISKLQNVHEPFHKINFHFINESILDIQHDIIKRSLNMTIPNHLLQLRNDQMKGLNIKDDNKAAPGPQKKAKAERRQAPNNNNDSEAIENPRPNQKWTIPANKTYKECFHNNKELKDKYPKFEGKQFCLQFFVSNRCKRGKACQFTHRDPRDVNKSTEFDLLCKMAYNN